MLESASFNQTFYNISSAQNNNKLQFFYHTVPTMFTVIIPNGYYSLQQLCDTISTLIITAVSHPFAVTLSIVGYTIEFFVASNRDFRFIAFTGA